MIEELASRVFAARDCAHRAHWSTSSYAQHAALGSFYDDVIDALDALIEAYQGLYGKIGAFDTKTALVGDMATYLTKEAHWIAENRDSFAMGSSAVGNLVDTLIEQYLTTIYKLKNLK